MTADLGLTPHRAADPEPAWTHHHLRRQDDPTPPENHQRDLIAERERGIREATQFRRDGMARTALTIIAQSVQHQASIIGISGVVIPVSYNRMQA